MQCSYNWHPRNESTSDKYINYKLKEAYNNNNNKITTNDKYFTVSKEFTPQVNLFKPLKS